MMNAKLIAALGMVITGMVPSAWGQLVLSGNSYTQDFDALDAGLPEGWSTRTGASASSLGVAPTFATEPKSWDDIGGAFGNYASPTNNLGALSTGEEDAATQAAYTNRVLGIRQTGSFGDPGAAFVFQALNTLGYSNVQFSVDFTMLSDQARTTVWTVDYGFGNAPTAYTTLGTYTNVGGFGTTVTTNFALGFDADNQAEVLTIRVVALTGSTGAGSRDSFGLDNFVLTYEGNAVPVPPTILASPVNRNNLVGTKALFQVAAQGAGPITYQWRKDGTNLSDGGDILGSESTELSLSNLQGADAGNYDVVVTNPNGSVTSAPPAVLTVANTGALAFWDFNDLAFDIGSPAPNDGDADATAGTVGSVSTFNSPVGSGNDFGSPNRGWGTSQYPAQGTLNKQAGVQFDVSLAGKKNVQISYDQRITGTGSKFTRLQFSTNGIDFVDTPVSSSHSAASIYETRSFDLSGYPGLRDNPNVSFRVVAEFESTATYGVVPNDNYAPVSGTYAVNGTITYDLFTISAAVITDANTPPAVSAVADFVIEDLAPPTNVNLTVSDAESAAATLLVTATSLNNSVLFDPVVGGSGSARTLTITPIPGLTGVAPILVTVTDPDGDVTTTWFFVTVTAGNQPPAISPIGHTNTLAGVPLEIAFTVDDDQTPVNSLIVTASSGNQVLLPNANVVVGGAGANRTVTLTPAAGEEGIAPVIIEVNDGEKSSQARFTLQVLPSTQILLVDGFDYDLSGPIVSVSEGFYQTHSGTPGQVQVSGGNLFVTQNASEDVNAPLIGEPYTTESGILYASLRVNFLELPIGGSSGGAYFAHFRDNGTGFRGRVWAVTNNAAPGTFRLAVSSASNTLLAEHPQDLELGTDYTVVVSYTPSNGVAQLWVDPVGPGEPGVTSLDASPQTINTFAIRQSFSNVGGMGTLTLDKLRVGTTLASVLGLPDPIPLSITRDGDNVVLDWGDPSLTLQSAPAVTGPFNDVPGATRPYTNAITGPEQYFRLRP